MKPSTKMTISISLLFILPLLMLVMIIEAKDNKSRLDACEELGGTYQVVGQEFSAALKRTIDMYGCVK